MDKIVICKMALRCRLAGMECIHTYPHTFEVYCDTDCDKFNYAFHGGGGREEGTKCHVIEESTPT